MTGTEVERVEHHGVAALEHFVVGKVLERRPAPRRRPAERLHGRHRRRRARPDRLRRAQRRRRPDGRRRPARRGDARRHDAEARPSCAASESNGMILAEDELGDRHRPRRDHGPRADDLDARARRSPSVLPIATDVLDARDHAQPARLPRRLRRRPRGPRRHRRAAAAAAVDRRSRHRRGPSTGVAVTVECPELCPRFTARVFEDVTIGPSRRRG